MDLLDSIPGGRAREREHKSNLTMNIALQPPAGSHIYVQRPEKRKKYCSAGQRQQHHVARGHLYPTVKQISFFNCPKWSTCLEACEGFRVRLYRLCFSIVLLGLSKLHSHLVSGARNRPVWSSVGDYEGNEWKLQFAPLTIWLFFSLQIVKWDDALIVSWPPPTASWSISFMITRYLLFDFGNPSIIIMADFE